MSSAGMIERVAMAIERAALAFGPPALSQTHDLTAVMARAAIEAMREPTDEMVAAGTRSIMAHGRASNAVCNAWRNMCRAALSKEM